MPAHVELVSKVEKQLLVQLGERIRRTRIAQGISTVEMAKKLEMSRSTLHAAESGEPSVAVGTYVRVLGKLGIAGDLALVASGVVEDSPTTSESWIESRTALEWHREAVRLLESDPGKRTRVLSHMRKVGPSPFRDALVEKWEYIIDSQDYSGLIASTESAEALRRQSSPFVALLPISLRVAIASAVRASAPLIDQATLQQAKADAAIEELRAIGVEAEVIGSLVWGDWDPERSDVDFLVIEQGEASDADIESIAETFVGSRHDVLYLDRMRAPSRAYLLKERAKHGRPAIELSEFAA